MRGVRVAGVVVAMAFLTATPLIPARADDTTFRASLDEACTPPLGHQGLTAATTPGDQVAWSTEYSDHSNELTSPSYQVFGGSGWGTADAAGLFHADWRVPPNAPMGTATVHLIGQGNIEPSVTFTVGIPTATC